MWKKKKDKAIVQRRPDSGSWIDAWERAEEREKERARSSETVSLIGGLLVLVRAGGCPNNLRKELFLLQARVS